MVECRYYSFYALAKINDPELLYDAFQQQIAPGHAHEIEVEVYEHSDKRWSRLTPSGALDLNIPNDVRNLLTHRFEKTDSGDWYYDSTIDGWFCSYNPLTTKRFVLMVKTLDKDLLIEEEYLQFLFHFYCHQLQMLRGTYRDALTGLYNRRAFNEKMTQMLDANAIYQRRTIDFKPTVYVMMDIDYFKSINDSMGHLYGDEVLLLIAQLMTDSFRENDLLFRYGGEEFAVVLMDITAEQSQISLDRFREKIAAYRFPNLKQVTISIGYTDFDKSLTMDEIIAQADSALYYCKATTRNAVHSYHDLVTRGLIPAIKPPQSSGGIEIF